MKLFFLLLMVVLSVAAKEIKNTIHLNVNHGGLLSTIIVQHVLGSMGYKTNIHRLSNANEAVEMDIVLHSKKQFDPKLFAEELSFHQITVSNGQLKNQLGTMELDASDALWNVPAITQDEGEQIERTGVASWFRVNNTSAITVEAPYGHKWYPEIAVLDNAMQPLISIRESISQESMTFQLPEHAMYLKVSNTNGMKMLKEGMWIESASDEQ
jgi:hypothetical protein